jgi:N-acyl homoserine lactone hydrolase
MSSGVRRIVLLTLGWADVAKSVSVEGAPHDPVLREPVPGVLLLCDGGWLLLDTGYNTALITDPALRARFHGNPLEVPLLPGPGEPLPEENGIFRVDFDDPRIDWRTAEGDVEIAPGVTAVLTAGHTPGHQSFVVEMDPSAGGGGFVFAFDAADLTENIEREVAVGGRIGASPEQSVAQIRKLKRIAAERGYRLVPGHDPDAWPALTAELAAKAGRPVPEPG